MKILYTYKTNTDPIFITNVASTAVVLAVFSDDFDEYVYYADLYNSKEYLNKIYNKFAIEKYSLLNFEVIKEDDQFNTYIKWIKDHYNYNGQHLTEKIDGNDLAPSIWLPER